MCIIVIDCPILSLTGGVSAGTAALPLKRCSPFCIGQLTPACFNESHKSKCNVCEKIPYFTVTSMSPLVTSSSIENKDGSRV